MELHVSQGDHPDADVDHSAIPKVGPGRRIGDGDDALAVQAVVPYGGRVSELIKGLKYDGEVDHARFLGHLLFRHLDGRIGRDQVDLVLPNPTYAHRGVRHTELLVAAMASADLEHRWPFEDPSNPCLVKVRATVSSHSQDELGRRKAAEAVERALEVRRPELIHGRRLLVVDDVTTTGEQLRAVARKLLAYGAEEVQGLVVARSGFPEQAAEAAGARSAAASSRVEALRQLRHGFDGPSL